ncbi:type IX secretion system protein PorQ [Parabacteroides bouchesdurhonensis]|uniref:type IX secretion system protein PorQ n=1 Tax=Parabacteroides bouchesdurhonensis TaxID=1936995 RepID=UPI000C83C111|nr:type IX secretion system protein PorQ [Parabacteroides bouchesdurhonensis]
MRNILFVLLISVLSGSAVAQDGSEVFNFLRIPNSARANALGGNTVSLVERDPSLIFHNPALLGAEMDGMINLNYMNYISDINVGSALFTKAFKERSAWGIGASFFSNGNMKETTDQNQIIGDFSAKDISVMGFFSHDLNERWRGGLSLKFLYSSIADYTSIGLCVDAGLSYYNSEKDFSVGITLKNIGAQLKPYDNKRQKMPWDIQAGISKKMAHAPIRLSLTAMYLNRWKFDYIDDSDSEYKGDNFFQAFAKHLVIGVDYIPSENFWLGIGFNPKTCMDMKLRDGGGALSGFSAGAGVKIKMFDVGVSLAKYNPSALSLMLSLSMTLEDFKN